MIDKVIKDSEKLFMIDGVMKDSETLLRKMGYDVVYIGLYGSQNYNLHDEESDIDLRAIVIPSLEDLILRKRISTMVETDYGVIDVKDLMTYVEVISKGNFSFIEPFQSPYYRGKEEFRHIFGSVPVNLLAVIGDMREKLKKYRKDSDCKSLHHYLRLHELVYNHKVKYLPKMTSVSYLSYHEGFIKEFLMDIKRDKKHLELDPDKMIEGYFFPDVEKGYSYKEQKQKNLERLRELAVEYVQKRILQDRWGLKP